MNIIRERLKARRWDRQLSGKRAWNEGWGDDLLFIGVPLLGFLGWWSYGIYLLVGWWLGW